MRNVLTRLHHKKISKAKAIIIIALLLSEIAGRAVSDRDKRNAKAIVSNFISTMRAGKYTVSVVADTTGATEIHHAINSRILDDLQTQGVTKKIWVVNPDACLICVDNADIGPIGIDDLFPSGDSCPPAHPNCRCILDQDD